MLQSLEILKKVFGYPQFRGSQAEVIEALLQNQDVLALMPTGAGKSLCYQVPALVKKGMALVISPLIALMKNQVDRLKELGVLAAYLNSSLSSAEQRQILQQIFEGQIKLLYVAPERAVTADFLNLISSQQISLIAIDEAHCVSQWGHDFRPEYLELAIFNQYFPKVPKIALTATADLPTREEILTKLALRSPKVFVSSFDRPNLKYEVRVKQKLKDQVLDFLKKQNPAESGIIYCLSRKKTEEIAAWLKSLGYVAIAYHAGLSNEERQKNQDLFLKEEGVIVVATIAFGMGIDKPDVRFVLHLDLPKSVESYFQETGRAGRDGLPANVTLFYGLSDVIQLKSFIENSNASLERKRLELQKINLLLGFCESVECRRKVLLHYFGETYLGPCHSCDNCLEKPEVWEATLAVQKAISCVYRVDQRFGVGHLIDILLGKKTAQVVKFRHDQLKTFGVGLDLSLQEWSSVFRQLIVGDYLFSDYQNYGAIKITERGFKTLKLQERVFFRKEVKLNKEKKKREGRSNERSSFHSTTEDALWEALRRCRKKLADQYKLPPYLVFHDATLKEMILFKPKTEGEMRLVSGVGDYKFEKYGRFFLEVLEKY